MASTGYLREKESKIMIEFIENNTAITKKTIYDILNWLDNKLYTTGCGYDMDAMFDTLEVDTEFISYLSNDNKQRLCDILVEITEETEYGFTWPEEVLYDLWEHHIITTEDIHDPEQENDDDPQPFIHKDPSVGED